MTATATQLLDMLIKTQAPAAQPIPVSQTPAVTQLSPDDLEAAREFAAAKELEKLAKELKEAAEAKIRERMGDATVGLFNDEQVIKINSGANSRLDAATVRDGWPEAYQAAKRTTDYTYVTVKLPVA